MGARLSFTLIGCAMFAGGCMVDVTAQAQEQRRTVSARITVEQIGPTRQPRGAEAGQDQQIANPEPRKTTGAIDQLPEGLETPDPEAVPENEIGSLAAPDPRVSLYNEIAQVWQSIRARGQQPTPELIAREIGPESLTRFLDTFPGSESIFGIDSDSLPLPEPDFESPEAFDFGDATSLPPGVIVTVKE